MKLIGWRNGRCGVVWRGVAIESADMMGRRYECFFQITALLRD